MIVISVDFQQFRMTLNMVDTTVNINQFYICIYLYRAIEHCLDRFPEHSNLKNDYGCTILHLAAFYNHCDIVNLAAEQVRDQFGVLECCYLNYLSIYICAQV